MHKPPWRNQIAAALQASSDDPTARFVQLATVTPEGRPANRTLVFRSFLPETEALMLVTDARSQKIRQLQQNPQAALCWYFTQSRQQFRLKGEVALITADHADPHLLTARQRAWSALSDSVRRQFLWPTPQKPRADDAAFSVASPATETPPENFVLLILHPSTVDVLDISQTPHGRTIYRLRPSGAWTAEDVNP